MQYHLSANFIHHLYGADTLNYYSEKITAGNCYTSLLPEKMDLRDFITNNSIPDRIIQIANRMNRSSPVKKINSQMIMEIIAGTGNSGMVNGCFSLGRFLCHAITPTACETN